MCVASSFGVLINTSEGKSPIHQLIVDGRMTTVCAWTPGLQEVVIEVIMPRDFHIGVCMGGALSDPGCGRRVAPFRRP